MELITGGSRWEAGWLQTVKAHLHTSTLVGRPLYDLRFDFFPSEEQLMADILQVFRRHRYNSDVSRAYRQGSRVESYTLTVDEGWSTIIDACRGNRVMVNVCQLQREIPYVGELAAMLSGALTCNVRIDAFCSAERTSATPIHYDYDNAFVAQVVGSKSWRCYDNLADVRLHFGGYRVDPKTVGPKHFEAVMSHGDGIFIPGGTLHEAFTTQDISVHLAIDLDPIAPAKAAASWLTGQLMELDVQGDAYHEMTVENSQSLRAKALADYGALSAHDVLRHNHTYRMWSQSGYARLAWQPLARDADRGLVFRLAPGSMFRMYMDGGALKMEYASHVPAAMSSHSWTFVPASATLPEGLKPVVEEIVRQPGGFTLADVDEMVHPDSTHVLMNALGRMGIVTASPVAH